MRRNRLAVITGSILFCIATAASAQTRTTGAIRGTVTDQQTGQPVTGATVVVSSPALQGTQAEITSPEGGYFITNLPPGNYRLTVYYADAQFTRGNVLVQLGKVAVVNVDIDTQATTGEVIELEGRVPIIDQGSTKTGRTITEDYTRNIPTGRTFGAVLGAAAGAQVDLFGYSFGGSTSAENVYIIEGINTTDPAYGLQSTNLPNEFIQETEVITGGYNAEYGRSTGGVINVLTKSGGNEFEGSVFSYFTPGALRAAEKVVQRTGNAIARNDDLAYDMSLGGELGGPIIKDRLWFHVGVNPGIRRYDVHRIIRTQIDEDHDREPDRDPDTGMVIMNEVARDTWTRGSHNTYFMAKLSGALAPEHQGALSFIANPGAGDTYLTVTGMQRAGLVKLEGGTWDVAGKWTSKLHDNKTELNAVLGWHRNANRYYPALPGGDATGYVLSTILPLTAYDWYERSMGGRVPEACVDEAPSDDVVSSDLYPGIDNCPVQHYRIGGIGGQELETTDRLSALLSATRRVDVLGQHVFKAGVDSEYQVYDRLARYTGGEFYRLLQSNVWRIYRYYRFLDGGPDVCEVDLDGNPNTKDDVVKATCEYAKDGLPATTQTHNIGAYIQDSWQIVPNLTLDLGVRWEQQRLLAADQIAGRTSGFTGEPIEPVAFRIGDMIAPRLGIIYDPTREGRARLFGHWGRFYESIPMDINARAFGGEVMNLSYLPKETCPPNLNGIPVATCPVTDAKRRTYLGAADKEVIPGLGGQYLDEVVVGGEYELFDDLKVGASYIHRSLGRIIEDVSPDNGITYIIANPGEVDMEAIEALRLQGEEGAKKAALFAAVAAFDDPVRTYDALELSAERRFSRNTMLIASYTLSRTYGNFPGLFSPDTGQLDPNLTSMYDLPALMSNRLGPLPADRTHQLKVDAYYRFDFAGPDYAVLGTGIQATSGVPHDYLGAHPDYGDEETFILPRGTGKRSPLATRVDVRLKYGRQLRKDMMLEAFVDVFNLLNQQPELAVDEEYTESFVNPIVGGDASDLAHLKVAGSDKLAIKNRNYGNPVAYQAPLRIQLGLRLTF